MIFCLLRKYSSLVFRPLQGETGSPDGYFNRGMRYGTALGPIWRMASAACRRCSSLSALKSLSHDPKLLPFHIGPIELKMAITTPSTAKAATATAIRVSRFFPMAESWQMRARDSTPLPDQEGCSWSRHQVPPAQRG